MEKPWRNTIAADMPVDHNWPLARELSDLIGEDFRIETLDGRAHVARTRRIVNYFRMGLRLFRHRKQTRLLVSWQQFFGVVFAWLCNLFRVNKTTTVVVMTFIYRSKHGLPGRIYHRWIRGVLHSGYVDRVIVYSRFEVEHYSRLFQVDKPLFVYAPLTTPTPPQLDTTERGYIFSTGSSNRDYDLLIGALAHTRHRLVIACHSLPQPEAKNIRVLHNTFNSDMLAHMAGADIVVVTLSDPNISSGQLVVLQAMSLGKPVIVTRSRGLEDYVADNVTGIVVDSDPSQLLQAVDTLQSDLHLRRRMGQAAREAYERNHTPRHLARAVAEVLTKQTE